MNPLPSHPSTGRTLFVLGLQNLCARVVIADWYRNASQSVAQQAAALESAYIARASYTALPAPGTLATPGTLAALATLGARTTGDTGHVVIRQDDAVVLVLDAVSGAPLLVHDDEIVDIDQRLYDEFAAQFKTALSHSTFVKTAMATAQSAARDVLPAIPHIAGCLAALVEKSNRLLALVTQNRNCTNREHLFVRATLGKKIAVELAQEFAGFRYQLRQHRSRASIALVKLSSGAISPKAYDQQFGMTDEQARLHLELSAVTLVEKETAGVSEPLQVLADSFEVSDIPLAVFDTLTKRLESVQEN
ncbi:MAG: hypothetical protein SGJ27_26830 [Candidatus Melainabacteria bacterium]|nr:hypothetical protein [Candidatus Melainabacteria bacterium]